MKSQNWIHYSQELEACSICRLLMFLFLGILVYFLMRSTFPIFPEKGSILSEQFQNDLLVFCSVNYISTIFQVFYFNHCCDYSCSFSLEQSIYFFLILALLFIPSQGDPFLFNFFSIFIPVPVSTFLLYPAPTCSYLKAIHSSRGG